ncbi:MAG: hypothetical protein ABSD57_00355 [Verrucomicrobiota bacterium]|jgi:hypothetical protein
MNPEAQSSLPSKAQPIGGVESMPLESALIQFIGHRQTYGRPKSDFRQLSFTLTEIRRQQPSRPPQELCLSGPGFTVTLVGWRLNLLPELLANGKINRIRAVDNTPGGLAVEGPLVCSIRIHWPGSERSIILLPSKGRS